MTKRRTACIPRPLFVIAPHLCTLQVYHLIMPCFHYTYNINANARSSLINANGVVEKARPVPVPLSAWHKYFSSPETSRRIMPIQYACTCLLS